MTLANIELIVGFVTVLTATVSIYQQVSKAEEHRRIFSRNRMQNEFNK